MQWINIVDNDDNNDARNVVFPSQPWAQLFKTNDVIS